MLRVLLIVVLVLAAAWGAVAVAAEVASRAGKPRGTMVEIGGGRSLRLVCAGPAVSPHPVVWMEAGAFSGAADFGAIQDKLAAKGVRSCAYDRAGMGYSPTGPNPRDGDAIVADLETLVAASGERGPFVMMGHSMAGLYVRQFALRNPDKVAGLVLLDAVTPEMIGLPGAQKFVDGMTGIARLGAFVGPLKAPLYLMGDRIGLPPAAKAEKRRGFISATQSRAAYAEVLSWRAAAEQAQAAGELDPNWPVAVITAGPATGRMEGWNLVRHAPARGSKAGSIDAVEAASHTTMLGLTYGDRVVAGVERVFEALR